MLDVRLDRTQVSISQTEFYTTIMEKIPMTAEGYTALDAELKRLKTEERPAVIQAIAEARTAGVHPFCLTVDRKGSDYLTRIFGAPGHLVLQDPGQLPRALLAVIRHLIRA